MEEKQAANEPMRITTDLAQRIQEELGENVYLCYQCVKCTNGCPVSEFFDWQPNQIMRAVQLGQENIALESQTPWLCAACQTCTTRCPQGLDINGILEFLTRESVARGFDPPAPQMKAFSEAFMREVRIWGRAYEPGLMAEMKLRNPKSLFDDLDIYVQMLKKGKVSMVPKLGRPPAHPKPIPEAEHSVAYYPGCSLHSTAGEFDGSARAVASALDLDLIEPDGWVCCGSSAAHRIDPTAATTLPMQNLALIEQSGFKEVTMPCAACFNRHKAAQFEIRHDEQHKISVDEALGYDYQDSVQVNTLTETILKHVGAEEVHSRVKKSLSGLRVVPYYGCLLTRPPQVTEVEHPENPTDMDELLAALGAEVVDWSYKTLCCGAAHALTRPDIVRTMSGNLVDHAREAGADAIAVACPLCHMNLDTRQMQLDNEEAIPVLYFTQLMALALDLPPKAAALNKNIVDPRPLLKERGIL